MHDPDVVFCLLDQDNKGCITVQELLRGVSWNVIWGVSKIRGYLFEGPHNKDYSTLGSVLGFPYLGKVPFNCYGWE